MAATYFKQLSSFYYDKQWPWLSTTMLNMWAECLEVLDNVRESVIIALRALRSAELHSYGLSSPAKSFDEIIKLSGHLKTCITNPLDHYLAKLRFDTTIHHDPNHDGFTICLEFRSLFKAPFKARLLSVQLQSLDEGSVLDLTPLDKGDTVVDPGDNTVHLSSQVSSNL